MRVYILLLCYSRRSEIITLWIFRDSQTQAGTERGQTQEAAAGGAQQPRGGQGAGESPGGQDQVRGGGGDHRGHSWVTCHHQEEGGSKSVIICLALVVTLTQSCLHLITHV